MVVIIIRPNTHYFTIAHFLVHFTWNLHLRSFLFFIWSALTTFPFYPATHKYQSAWMDESRTTAYVNTNATNHLMKEKDTQRLLRSSPFALLPHATFVCGFWTLVMKALCRHGVSQWNQNLWSQQWNRSLRQRRIPKKLRNWYWDSEWGEFGYSNWCRKL